MEIKAAVIHHLKKDKETSGEKSVTVHLRGTLLPDDKTLAAVCSQTLNLFGKKGNNTGTFGSNPDKHIFPVRLKENKGGTAGFLKLSNSIAGIIEEEMKGAHLATGGHAFIVSYEASGEDLLLVAMLKLKEGAGIDDVKLELKPTLVIDTEKLHEAARVNLTRWKSGKEPYLTFVKGKGSEEVTAYFRKALSCIGYTSSKHHTEQVIEAAKQYVSQLSDLDDDQKSERWKKVRADLHLCLSSNKIEVSLESIAAAIAPNNEEDFKDFVTTGKKSGAFSFDHSFKPEPSVYRGLRRVHGKMGTVSVSFDVQDIMTKKVTYDASTDALLIHNPSAELVSEVKANAAPGS